MFDILKLLVRRGRVLPETVDVMRSWELSRFNIGWDRRLQAEDRRGLQGLLSYMERAPVSLRRLTYSDDGLVHYQGTKVHPRLVIDHQLLPPLEFLALLVPQHLDALSGFLSPLGCELRKNRCTGTSGHDRPAISTES